MLDAALDQSTVLRLLSDTRKRLRSATAVITRALTTSEDERSGIESDSITRRALEQSVFNSKLTAARVVATTTVHRIRRAVATPLLLDLGATLHRYIIASLSFRWLTTQPDPDAIVIDLRETWTVGPVIRAVDRVVHGLERGARTSITVAVVCRVVSHIPDRPIQVVSALVLLVTTASLLVWTLTTSLSSTLLVGHLLVAGLAILGSRSRSRLGTVLKTRLMRGLITVFKPPELLERLEGQSRRGDQRADEQRDEETRDE